MNKKTFIKKIIISLVSFSLNFLCFAEKIQFSANSMTGKTNDSSSTTQLDGNAYILTETIEISADSISLFGDDYRFIKAFGNIKGKNLETKMEFSADVLNFDRTTKIATLIGNVKLIDIENSVTAKAQRIEYDQEKEIAILQIEVNLTQKENECSGAYAIYHKIDQILELSGNAQVKQNQDTFRAQNIHFDMETEEIKLGGNVKGSVTEKKDSKTTETTTNKDKKQTGKQKASENSENVVDKQFEVKEDNSKEEQNNTEIVDVKKEETESSVVKKVVQNNDSQENALRDDINENQKEGN